MRRVWPLAAALVGVGALWLGEAPRALAGGFCQVQIESILACDTGSDFDARLRTLERRLNALFHYSSYNLLRREKRRIGWGQPARFTIPGRHLLVIKPRRSAGERLAMKVMLAHEGRPLVGTEVLMKNHGVFLMGGPRHDEGVLIISIGAQAE